MKPENKAARVQLNKIYDSAKPKATKTPKRKTMDKRYEVFNDEGLSIGFLTVHGKVKG
jgi:hypothetical protein